MRSEGMVVPFGSRLLADALRDGTWLDPRQTPSRRGTSEYRQSGTPWTNWPRASRLCVTGGGGVRRGAQRERSDRSAGPCRGAPLPPVTCAEGALSQ